MHYLIRIEWLGGAYGSDTPHAGRYLSAYDPDYFGGLGDIRTTVAPEDAMHFDNMGAAFEYYRQTSRIQPRRPDGRPNRPLTAYSVTIEPYTKENP